jgi:hypothetical protein
VKGYVIFLTKKTNIFYSAKLIFRSFATFFGLILFWSGAKQRFCFTGCRSVWNQTARIWALDFLARWQATPSIRTFLTPPYISIFLVLKVSKTGHFLTPPPPYKFLRNIWMVPCSTEVPAMSTPTKWSIRALLHFRRSPPLKKGQLISKQFGAPIRQLKMSDIFAQNLPCVIFHGQISFIYCFLIKITQVFHGKIWNIKIQVYKYWLLR